MHNRRLKAMKLVEGRYPNLVWPPRLPPRTGQKAKHIRDKGLIASIIVT